MVFFVSSMKLPDFIIAVISWWWSERIVSILPNNSYKFCLLVRKRLQQIWFFEMITSWFICKLQKWSHFLINSLEWWFSITILIPPLIFLNKSQKKSNNQLKSYKNSLSYLVTLYLLTFAIVALIDEIIR